LDIVHSGRACIHTRPFCNVNFERLCRVFPRDPQLRIESALFERHDANLDVHWSDCHPADGGGGTHARQPIRWRVLGGPCAWVARRCPPPPARRSPPPHLALGTSASLRHLHCCSLRCHQQTLHHVPCKAALVLGSRTNVLRRRPAARSSPAASPPRPVHHVDSCCCLLCLRAAAPCPPPCRALPRAVLTTPRPSHPQPSARNRPGERMSLLDGSTYDRPDAEVLPLITPAAARATDSVRRISHATLGTAPPGGEAIDGAGAGEGPQGEAAAQPYDSAPSPSLARPPQAPCPSHPPHPPRRSPTSLLLCSTHRAGVRPFTGPLSSAHRWRWCRRSSRRTRRPPRRGTMYAAPPPLPRG
jgi:hypothetical protein